MADLRPEGTHEPGPVLAAGVEDAVLLHLREVQTAYAAARVRAQIQEAGLRDTREQLERIQAAHSDLTRELDETRQQADREKDELDQLHAREKENLHRRLTEEKAQVEQQKAQVEQQVAQETQRRAAQEQNTSRQRERADRLERIIKELHQELFSGNIYALILRACLTITGATRGIHVAVRQGEDRLRVRAAIGFDGSGGEPLSPSMAALCRQVLDDGEPLLLNGGGDDRSLLPSPVVGDGDIRNAVVVPVVLRQNFNGVILVANKDGDFDRDDADAIISVGSHAAVAVENARLRRELQRAYLGTVSALADAMEAKDAYTQGHCDQVAHLARLTSERLRLADDDRAVVAYGALLHDIGKIGISDGILNKPGALLPEERALMHSHVRVGRDLIRHVPVLEPVADAVLHHHEWYDGTGYPDGLAGEAIPIAARVIGAVDAYCAMISVRSYKEAYSEERARDELSHCAGAQFDPRVVEALLAVLASPEASHHDEDEDEDNMLTLPGFGRLDEYRQANG